MLLRKINSRLINRFFTRCWCDASVNHISDLIKENNDILSQNRKRNIKVAILGAPNAGKSTLINKIVGHPVLCVSKKVHTTRHRERAAVVRDNTQILFVDTPGLVPLSSIKKHNLESSFREEGLKAVREANIVGVVHDAANIWTQGYLNPNVLHILRNMENKPSFLVLNKIDAIKSKKKLLDLVRCLTEPQNPTLPSEGNYRNNGESQDGMSSAIQNDTTEKKMHRARAWPNFCEVFMVSALNGDGISEIVDFLIKEAEDGKWALPPGRITDRSWPTVLKELVRGRLLDALPKEVPYHLDVQTEYFHYNELGEVVAVVLVTCPLLRHTKMLISGNGRVVRQVATQAEYDARTTLNTNVRLRVVVTSKEKQSPNQNNVKLR